MPALNRISFLVLSFVLTASACGPGAQQRTVKSTFVGLNAARDGFIAWDADYQKNIVGAAADFESGKLVLTDYRERREPVIRALAAAYRAVAAAALDTDDVTVAGALAAAIEVYQAIELLTGRPAQKSPPAD
jgi:hypothetical protein